MKRMIVKLIGFYLNSLAYINPKLAAHKGFELFCKPFRIALKDYQKEFLNSAEHFTFENSSITIQGYRWGKGKKVIIFLHGWESHSFRWKNYVNSFSKEEYTLYSIDAPGHGLSGGNFLSVPFYSSVIRQFISETGNIHAIIGHSIGAFSALHAFHEEPTLPVDRIVLMAAPGNASDFFTFYEQQLGLSKKTQSLILDYFEKKFNHPVSHFSSERYAPSVSIPVLIIHDKEDKEAPYYYSQTLHKYCKQSKLITTKGLGHNLKGQEVIDIVVGFVGKSESILV